MTKDEDGAKDKQKWPPGSIFINIEQPDQAHIDSINWEERIEKLDASQRSERAARMKWTMGLPGHAAKPTSVAFPVGPWSIPFDQAQQCYIYGFYRAAIAMSGSIAESMCLTLLHMIVGKDKKYGKLSLGKLIRQVEKSVSFLDQENLCRLWEINKIRNKWVHMKSDDLLTDMMQAVKREELTARPDAERILILVHETLGSVFEFRPASRGMVQFVICAQEKQ